MVTTHDKRVLSAVFLPLSELFCVMNVLSGWFEASSVVRFIAMFNISGRGIATALRARQ